MVGWGVSMKIDLTTLTKRLMEEQQENDKKRALAAESFAPQTFTLEPYECQQLSEWLVEHNKTCTMRWNSDGTPIKFPGGAVGGLLTYKFTPIGIGMAFYVSCVCKEEVNLTDYNNW